MVLKNVRRTLESGDTVYGYCRDSGGSEQERSVSDQIAEIQEYAAGHGLHIARIYADVGLSGANDRRPEFQAMIAACRADPSPVQGILVWHLNRIGRNELDRQFYLADLRRRGLVVVSMSQRSLLEGPMAGPMEAMLAWHDQQFLLDLRADVKRGLERAGTLRNHGQKAPAGYRRTVVNVGTHRDGTSRNVQRWVVDEEDAEKVRVAFFMYATGSSYREIHDVVDLQHTTYGYWSMFQNPLYIGIVKVGDYQRIDESLRIISDDLWEAAQRRRKTQIAPRSQSSEYLLSQLLRCGICGKAMVGLANRTKADRDANPHRISHRYYRCTAFNARLTEKLCQPLIRTEVLEQKVLEQVYSHLTDESIDEIVRERESRTTEGQVASEIARTDAEIAMAKKGIANLVTLTKIGGIAGDEVLRQIAELETQIAALVQKRIGLAEKKRTAPNPQKVRAALEAARTDLRSKELTAMRRALRSMIDRIIVTPTGAEIVYKEDVLYLN